MQTRLALSISLLALLSPAAQAQQMDVAAMQYWGGAELIHYRIVGVYQDATFVASDGAGEGGDEARGIFAARSHVVWHAD